MHGGSGIALGLIEQLRAARPDARFLELVHRLDRETSGVLLVAKKRVGADRLCTRNFATAKSTSAIWRSCAGRGRTRSASSMCRCINLQRARASGASAEPSGRASMTIFRREQAWPAHEPPLALLEAELKTGRTHQIRVHLAHLGHALAGDDKYGDFAWNRELAQQGLKRMFLHARAVAFRHPASGEPTLIASPLPEELARFLARSSDAPR